MIRVRLTGQLRDLTNGAREIELDSASDIDGVVGELDRTFPGIARKIVDDQGKIRPYVNVFVNTENSRDLGKEKTKLKDGDTVHILPSVAGG
ncbi:MAG: MoaD family protein [Nitrososphaerota archaeon]|nr:MoaD family protein [Nitrososphaerota archaeon]MDG7023630.1 MoaD family protein [Nitrososphaerota archaeon]